jgi:hypothetical protein
MYGVRQPDAALDVWILAACCNPARIQTSKAAFQAPHSKSSTSKPTACGSTFLAIARRVRPCSTWTSNGVDSSYWLKDFDAVGGIEIARVVDF